MFKEIFKKQKFSLGREPASEVVLMSKSQPIPGGFHFSLDGNPLGSRAPLSATDIPRNRRENRVARSARISSLCAGNCAAYS